MNKPAHSPTRERLLQTVGNAVELGRNAVEHAQATVIKIGKCDNPNPGTIPSGCATCSNGGLDNMNPQMTFLNIQSCGWCPNELPDPVPEEQEPVKALK